MQTGFRLRDKHTSSGKVRGSRDLAVSTSADASQVTGPQWSSPSFNLFYLSSAKGVGHRSGYFFRTTYIEIPKTIHILMYDTIIHWQYGAIINPLQRRKRKSQPHIDVISMYKSYMLGPWGKGFTPRQPNRAAVLRFKTELPLVLQISYELETQRLPLPKSCDRGGQQTVRICRGFLPRSRPSDSQPGYIYRHGI